MANVWEAIFPSTDSTAHKWELRFASDYGSREYMPGKTVEEMHFRNYNVLQIL